MNTNNTNIKLTLTTYETHATDSYGNTYIAKNSSLSCVGCAFNVKGELLLPCIINTMCIANKRINNSNIIWEEVENLPILNIPINTLRHLFIESLLSIRNGTKRDDSLRICGNLHNNLFDELPHLYLNYWGLLCRFARDCVIKFCQSWEYYSGSLNYPIPDDVQNINNHLLWHGDNLTYRISLIDHLISQIKSAEFETFIIDVINKYNGIMDTE